MQYKFDKQNHIHTLDSKPLIGTSSMASVLSKPLTWWASGLACSKFGWINKKNEEGKPRPLQERLDSANTTLNKIKGMKVESYLELCDDAYKAHSVKLDNSAQIGTDMHSVMESYIKDCLNKNEGKPIKDYKTSFVAISESNINKLQILVDWSIVNVKRFLFSEVYCYSEKLWLGGISDCGFEDNEGKYAILDFKSSKEVYLSQFWQCIAYAIELEENGGFTEDGSKVITFEKPFDYVAVLPFGMKQPSVQTNFDMVGGKEAVNAMITLYKKLN